MNAESARPRVDSFSRLQCSDSNRAASCQNPDREGGAAFARLPGGRGSDLGSPPRFWITTLSLRLRDAKRSAIFGIDVTAPQRT